MHCCGRDVRFLDGSYANCVDRLGEPLQSEGCWADELQALNLACQVDHGLARQYLSRGCLRAEPSSEIQGTSSISVLAHHDCFTGVQTDAHVERRRVFGRPTAPRWGGAGGDASPLRLDRGTQRLPRRVEGGHRLVTAQLHDLPVVFPDGVVHEGSEAHRKASSRLVTLLFRPARVIAHVGDEEGADGRWPLITQDPPRSFVCSCLLSRPQEGGTGLLWQVKSIRELAGGVKARPSIDTAFETELAG